jgi:DNA repair protein RadC
MKPCTSNGNSPYDPSSSQNIYALPRFRVSLVRENRAAAPSLPITTSVTAAVLLAPCFKDIDREQFVICGLDAKHRIIGLNIVSIGSLTLSIVHPREVFKPLILMNACAALGVHNLCGALHKLCYVALRIMWSSCTRTRLRLPETCESTVSSCT